MGPTRCVHPSPTPPFSRSCTKTPKTVDFPAQMTSRWVTGLVPDSLLGPSSQEQIEQLGVHAGPCRGCRGQSSNGQGGPQHKLPLHAKKRTSLDPVQSASGLNSRGSEILKLKPGLVDQHKSIFIQVGGANIRYLTNVNLVFIYILHRMVCEPPSGLRPWAHR